MLEKVICGTRTVIFFFTGNERHGKDKSFSAGVSTIVDLSYKTQTSNSVTQFATTLLLVLRYDWV